jgi:hypothetical protein
MKKIICFIFIITLTGCADSKQIDDNNYISKSEYLDMIETLNNKIENLESEIAYLKDNSNNNQLVDINPNELGEKLIYIDSDMQFAIIIPKIDDLPLSVKGNGEGLALYYIAEDGNQFICGFTKIPKVILGTWYFSTFYDENDIVKEINADWVIVKTISIETSLDEETNTKINDFLKQIIYY